MEEGVVSGPSGTRRSYTKDEKLRVLGSIKICTKHASIFTSVQRMFYAGLKTKNSKRGSRYLGIIIS